MLSNNASLWILQKLTGIRRMTALPWYQILHNCVDFQAALAAVRIIHKVPELTEMFVRVAKPMLNEKKHGKVAASFLPAIIIYMYCLVKRRLYQHGPKTNHNHMIH